MSLSSSMEAPSPPAGEPQSGSLHLTGAAGPHLPSPHRVPRHSPVRPAAWDPAERRPAPETHRQAHQRHADGTATWAWPSPAHPVTLTRQRELGLGSAAPRTDLTHTGSQPGPGACDATPGFPGHQIEQQVGAQPAPRTPSPSHPNRLGRPGMYPRARPVPALPNFRAATLRPACISLPAKATLPAPASTGPGHPRRSVPPPHPGQPTPRASQTARCTSAESTSDGQGNGGTERLGVLPKVAQLGGAETEFEPCPWLHPTSGARGLRWTPQSTWCLGGRPTRQL